MHAKPLPQRVNLIGAWHVVCDSQRERRMPDMSKIKEHMKVIGADGVHIGTVDRVENNRIKLIKSDSGEGKHKGHHHYIDSSLIAEVDRKSVV